MNVAEYNLRCIHHIDGTISAFADRGFLSMCIKNNVNVIRCSTCDTEIPLSNYVIGLIKELKENI